MEPEYLLHEIEPVFNVHSKVLLLGSFPSPKSREAGFFYGHRRNRFWPVLAELLGSTLPQTNEEKKQLLLVHGIALWDVLASCVITGADDSSIRKPVANDLSRILDHAAITAVFTTGMKAAAFYKTYCLPKTGIQAISLPSTSPANCRMPYVQLKQAYAQILQYL